MDVLRGFLWLLLLLTRGLWRFSRWLRPYIFRGSKVGARSEGTHGTARWSTRWEILRSGILTGHGPVIGRGPWGRLLRFTQDGIVMVFAATGAGKGLGIVVPTLLDYPGSTVVTDPKGENFAITARRRATFGRVLKLSPTDLAGSARFNPLDTIRVGTDLEAIDAEALARLVLVPSGSSELHWDQKAASLLTALILHTLHLPDPDLRNLAKVRSLSVGQIETFRDTLEEIATTSPSPHAREIASGFLGTLPTKAGEKNPEFSGILSTLHTSTQPWSRGTPAGTLSARSTFSMMDLVDSVCSLYLCVDEELLKVYAPWLRVMTGCALNAMMRAKDRPRPTYKPVFLLDEVAALGPLEPLEANAGLLRTYCTPVLIWQNMPQAASVYGHERATSLLANCSCRVFFGVSDNDTATYVATMLGNTTTWSASQGVSQSSEVWLRENRSHNQSESGYWLLDPAEVQSRPLTMVMARLRHMEFPVKCRRLDYRNVPSWWGTWDKWRESPPAPSQASGAAPVPLNPTPHHQRAA